MKREKNYFCVQNSWSTIMSKVHGQRKGKHCTGHPSKQNDKSLWMFCHFKRKSISLLYIRFVMITIIQFLLLHHGSLSALPLKMYCHKIKVNWSITCISTSSAQNALHPLVSCFIYLYVNILWDNSNWFICWETNINLLGNLADTN